MGGEATGSQSWQSEGYLYPSQLSGREHTAEGLGYFMTSANPCRVSSWWKHVRQRMRSVQGLCWLGRVAVIAMAKAGRESEWFPPPAIDPEVGPHAAKHLKVAHVSVWQRQLRGMSLVGTRVFQHIATYHNRLSRVHVSTSLDSV